MNFSRNVSGGHRLRDLGLVTDRDQSKVMDRLHALAGEHALIGMYISEEQAVERMEKRALNEAKARKAGGDMERIRQHPLWHEDADPAWFVVSHIDEKGRRWCHADAVQQMQSLVRGWLIRNKRHRSRQRVEHHRMTNAAIRVQRQWKKILFRRFVAVLRVERFKRAREDLARIVRMSLIYAAFQADKAVLLVAVRLVQRYWRRIRFKRILQLLREKRLLDATLRVQRKFRDHRTWRMMMKLENAMVLAKAKKLREEYLFGTKTAEETEKLRKQTDELFNKETSILGRKIAFSKRLAKHLEKELEGVIDDGMHKPAVSVALGDVAHVTKDDYWSLDAVEKDPHEVAIKVHKAAIAEATALDLSGLTTNLKTKLKRYPYAMQGKHSLLHLVQLNMSNNELVGCPLDLYNLTRLKDLRLENNRIRFMLPEIGKLKALTVLWLHENQLTTLPNESGELHNLYHLSLAYNKILSVPGTIGFITSLRELRLEGNPEIACPTLDMVRRIKRPPRHSWDIDEVMEFLRLIGEGQAKSELYLDGLGMLKVPSVLDSYTGLKLISLRGNRITEIPPKMLDMHLLEALLLDDNRIEKLSKYVFNLISLSELSLRRNRIKQRGMPINSMLMLTQLTALNLSLNLLVTPPPEILLLDAQTIIDYMHRVMSSEDTRYLDLSTFHLKVIPQSDVDRHLRSLTLADNLLPDIPRPVFRCGHLTKLVLSSNLIRQIPPEIERLNLLVTLLLDVNSIRSLPDEMAALEELAELNLNRNRLTELPDVIGNMTSLTLLTAAHNTIASVSTTLGCLQELKELSLSHNAIDELPDVMTGMTRLLKLSLEANRIVKIPDSIARCSAVEDVSFCKNRLVSVSPSICRLSNVTRVRLSDCGIKAMPKDMRLMEALETIDLDRNELESLPDGLCTLRSVKTIRVRENFLSDLNPRIMSLSSLVCLDLSRNKLLSVCAEIRWMSSLVTLNLSHNRLRKLPPIIPHAGAVLGRLANLEVLDVSSNQLRSLPTDLRDCASLKHVVLDGNVWSEDAGMARLMDPNKREGAGELRFRVVQAKGLQRMDGRNGLSDPFLVVEFGGKKVETGVMRGNLNPQWDQEFRFVLNGDSGDGTVASMTLYDWDPDGSNDLMGEMSITITKETIRRCTVTEDDEDAQGTTQWVYVGGEDEMGRKAIGKVQIGLMFKPLTGSLKSIKEHLLMLQREGWMQIPGVDVANYRRKFAPKKTPDGMVFEDEVDEAREADQIVRMDQFRKWVTDWVMNERSKKEAWESVDVFFTPPGVVNEPWLIGKERYDNQFDLMREYLRMKAREDPKGQQQDPWERYSKEEADKALTELLRDEFDLDLAMQERDYEDQ